LLRSKRAVFFLMFRFLYFVLSRCFDLLLADVLICYLLIFSRLLLFKHADL
jgi:hypothetical protein